jgi:hypothetical protein
MKRQQKSKSMHSFHHSSSPMHLPAAVDALIVLADNDAPQPPSLMWLHALTDNAGGRGGTTRESRSRHTGTSTGDWLDEGVR